MGKYEVVWILVHYNILRFINLTKLTLKNISNSGIKSLIYIFDNGSTDGSNIALRGFMKELSVDIIYRRSPINLGFTRAAYLVWRDVSNMSFEYIALVNDDLVIVPSSTKKLLDVLGSTNYAGIQGTIMQLTNPSLIDNAGFVIDRWGFAYPICRGRRLECAKRYEPSYLSGAYSIYRKESVMRAGGLFDPLFEAYFDDRELGLRLRGAGFRLLHVPLVSGYHLGSATYGASRLFKSPTWFKYVTMAELITVEKCSPPPLRFFARLKFLGAGTLASLLTRRDYVSSFVDGLRHAVRFRKKVGHCSDERLGVITALLQTHLRGPTIKRHDGTPK